MASTRSSRSSARQGSGNRGRSSGSSDSSQMMVMVGAAAIAIVIILVVVMRGDGETTDKTDKGTTQTPPVASTPQTPAAAPASGREKAGKPPTKPAPILSQETLTQLDVILERAKALYNEGVTMRTAGDNSGARDKQALAKDQLDEWKGLVSEQLMWQEEADLENWSQPASYDVLTQKYAGFSRLEKSVRMGGGK